MNTEKTPCARKGRVLDDPTVGVPLVRPDALHVLEPTKAVSPMTRASSSGASTVAAAGLEAALREAVDAEIRFGAGSRGPVPRTVPTTGRCRSAWSSRAAWSRVPTRSGCAPPSAPRSCRWTPTSWTRAVAVRSATSVSMTVARHAGPCIWPRCLRSASGGEPARPGPRASGRVPLPHGLVRDHRGRRPHGRGGNGRRSQSPPRTAPSVTVSLHSNLRKGLRTCR
jgi:hypothetical protein